jgi:hypothetical protein
MLTLAMDLLIVVLTLKLLAINDVDTVDTFRRIHHSIITWKLSWWFSEIKGYFFTRMKNIAVLCIPSVTFSSEIVHGQTIYRDLDKFTHRIGNLLRGSLMESGVECSDVKRSYKPEGSGFHAGSSPARYFVSVSIESSVLPEAEVSIGGDPGRGADRIWDKFEPLFRRAVAHAFPLFEPLWMTEDEFIKSKSGISK